MGHLFENEKGKRNRKRREDRGERRGQRSTAGVGVSLCSSMVSVKRKRKAHRVPSWMIHETAAVVFLG